MGDWSFIPRETLGNDAKHAPHKYVAQEERELGYLYCHTQESLIEDNSGLLISEHVMLASHSDCCSWGKKSRVPGYRDAHTDRQAEGEGHG